MASFGEELEQHLSGIARLVRLPAVLPDGTSMHRSTSSLLHLLENDGPMRIGAVAAAFGLDPSTVTRQIQQAARGGYVERFADPTDHRATMLRLTEQGRAVRRSVADLQHHGLDSVTADWSDSDKAELVRLLGMFLDSVASLREGLADKAHPAEP